MKKQFWIAVCLLGFITIYLKYFGTVEAVLLPQNLADFPKQIGSFTMTGSDEFSEGVLNELRVDEYIYRRYQDKDGYSISLYIGYYEEQKEGTLIHSPKHCMPGSGWNPVETDVVPIHDAKRDHTFKVNKILFQKGMDKISMLYWYQGRNRIVANEYVDRIYLILDSILQHRSEGALIRVMGPLTVNHIIFKINNYISTRNP
jgi:EpsI family protein